MRHHKRSNAVNISRPTFQGSSALPLADAILAPNPRVLNLPPATPHVNLDAMRRLEGIQPISHVDVVMSDSPTDSPTLKRYRQPRILASVHRRTPSRRHHAATILRRRSSSAYHASPSTSPKLYKAAAGTHGVERALDDLLHSLKVATSPARREAQVSVWSSSSDDDSDIRDAASSAFTWFSRKSEDKASTHRSRPSRDTTASHSSNPSHDSSTGASQAHKSHKAATSADSALSQFTASLKSKSSMASLKHKSSLVSLRSIRSGKQSFKREKNVDAPLPLASSSTWSLSTAPAAPETCHDATAEKPLYPPLTPTTPAATPASAPHMPTTPSTTGRYRNKLVQDLVLSLRTKRSRTPVRRAPESFTTRVADVADSERRHITILQRAPGSAPQGPLVSRPSSPVLPKLSHTMSLEQSWADSTNPAVPSPNEPCAQRPTIVDFVYAQEGPSDDDDYANSRHPFTQSAPFPALPPLSCSAYSPCARINNLHKGPPRPSNHDTTTSLFEGKMDIAGGIGTSASPLIYKEDHMSPVSTRNLQPADTVPRTPTLKRISTSGRSIFRLSTSPPSFNLRRPFRRISFSASSTPIATPPSIPSAMVLVTPHRPPKMHSARSCSKAEAMLGVRIPRANTDFVCEETVSFDDTTSDSELDVDEQVTIATPQRGHRATAMTLASRPSSSRPPSSRYSPAPSPSLLRDSPDITPQASPAHTPAMSFSSLSEISDMTNDSSLPFYTVAGPMGTFRPRKESSSGLSARRILNSLKRKASRPITPLTIASTMATPIASPLATPTALRPSSTDRYDDLADVIERNFASTHPYGVSSKFDSLPTSLRPPRATRVSPTPSIETSPAPPIPISRHSGLPPHQSKRKFPGRQWPEWPPRWDSPEPILPSNASVHTFGASCRSRRSSIASNAVDFSKPRSGMDVDNDDDW